MKKILEIICKGLLIGLTTFIIFRGCLYVKFIKSDIDNVKNRQDELYGNQAIIYDEIIKQAKINNIILNIITSSQIEAETFKYKLNELEEEIKRPSYDYLKSITAMVFRHVPGVTKGWLGTGTIVKITEDFTYIITNKHIVNGCPSEYTCTIVDDVYNKYPAEIVKTSSLGYDMALIRITGRLPNKIAVKGITNAVHQEKVFMVGHHLGRPYLYSEGTISGYDPSLGYSLVAGLPTAPGNSGSAIINVNGEMVGLVYLGRIAGKYPYLTLDLTHGICIDGRVIKLFLESIL